MFINIEKPKVALGQNSLEGRFQAKAALFGPPKIDKKIRTPGIRVAGPRDHTVDSWKHLMHTLQFLW